MMLLLGVLVYGESFGYTRLIAFVLVAAALSLYTVSMRRSAGKAGSVLD